MAEQLKPTHGVMEGGGSYNRHARIPAAAGRLTLPILDEAVRSLALASDDRPVVIADYGSSQGTNSLIPIRAAVKVLRARAGADRPILVVHVDQVANDFNTLFAVLHSDPDCYSIDDANVFSAWMVIVRSGVAEPDTLDHSWPLHGAGKRWRGSCSV